MKQIFRSLPLLVMVASLFLISCGKDGEPGPAGPEGPAGPAGPAGSGSSGIIYSAWLDVPYKPDTVHTAGGTIDTVGYFTEISAPKLTMAHLNQGEVKVYINFNSAANPEITLLPYMQENGVLIRFSAVEKLIHISSNVDAGTYTRNGAKYLQHRYVIIPGGTAARSAAGAIDWNDYQAVKAYLGLKD